MSKDWKADVKADVAAARKNWQTVALMRTGFASSPGRLGASLLAVMLCAVLAQPARALTSNTRFTSAVAVTKETAYRGVFEGGAEAHTGLFGADNPVNMVDPSGHDDIGDVMGAMDISASLDALPNITTVQGALSSIAFSPGIIVYISVDPTGEPSSFNPSSVQNALQTQLSASVFDHPAAGQSLTIKIHNQNSPPGSPGWQGSPKHLYINRVDWNLHFGIASSGNNPNDNSWWGAGGYTSINAQGVTDYCNANGNGPTTQTYVNILAHEVIWLNAGGNWDHDVNGSSDISNGKGYPAFAPFTVSASNRLKLRGEFGF